VIVDEATTDKASRLFLFYFSFQSFELLAKRDLNDSGELEERKRDEALGNFCGRGFEKEVA
jgi:hypothetical protein